MFNRHHLALGLLFLLPPASASYRVYEADIADSNWQFSGTPLKCNLSHKVTHYGNATFSKDSGKNKPLKFAMSYKRHPITTVKVASVQSMSPSWFPNQRTKSLGEVPISNGKSIFQTQDTGSWKLLNELEIGRFPMFRYQDFESLEDQVAVSLSSVGFKQPYDQFLDCLSDLVPYQLDELKQMTLRFDFAKHTIRKNYQDKLKALAQYVRHDPNLEVVLLSGHTDSKGSRGYNHKLSERRIASVQALLTLPGTDTSRFKTEAHGERKPIASNRQVNGRALNRRVYIRID